MDDEMFAREKTRRFEGLKGAARKLPSIIAVSIAAYVLGGYSFKNDLPPAPYIRSLEQWISSKAYAYDEFGRLTAYSGKIELSCPMQDDKTGVIFAFGQSNSANHGEKYTALANYRNILNYFDGKCYDALPPLLGASGDRGSFLPLLADKLVAAGIYDKVVIISSGVAGTNIARWGSGGDLHGIARDVIRNFVGKYDVTDIIWHQGESDYLANTSVDEYESQFRSLLDMVRENTIRAPAYIGIASKCNMMSFFEKRWRSSNSVTEAQQKLVKSGLVVLGADTDQLITDNFRLPDKCHFNFSGEMATADAYAEAIKLHHGVKSIAVE
ncbi:sialate O-acetylesterase [Methylocystis sp. 9N]|uniref:Sialate O-acetylesterase n=1 Tax=Methylocystis borbori TaxID=3118750 RepID=A0ABU7XGD8_9HYPH